MAKKAGAKKAEAATEEFDLASGASDDLDVPAGVTEFVRRRVRLSTTPCS